MDLDKTLTNDYDIIKFINFCNYQISYNITTILYEFDFYFERDDFSFIYNYFKKFKIQTIDNKKIIEYNDEKYYRDNNILYMEKNNKLYWIDNNIYFVKSNNIILEDNEKTFKSINNRFFSDLNIIKILNGIVNIINKIIIYDSFVSVSTNKLKFINICTCSLKIINLNFFFYLNNNKFYVKDIWEITQENNKKNIVLIGINLMYLFREFSSVNLKIRSFNF